MMIPSSWLDASITRVGPSQYPQHTGAPFWEEAVGSSQYDHHRAPQPQRTMSPTLYTRRRSLAVFSSFFPYFCFSCSPFFFQSSDQTPKLHAQRAVGERVKAGETASGPREEHVGQHVGSSKTEARDEELEQTTSRDVRRDEQSQREPAVKQRQALYGEQ